MSDELVMRKIIEKLDAMDRKLSEVDEKVDKISEEQAKQNESPGDRQLRRVMPGGFS